MTPHWERQLRAAAGAVLPVLEVERSAVGLGDLATEDETDAAPSRFGGEERHEEVRGLREAGPSSSTRS